VRLSCPARAGARARLSGQPRLHAAGGARSSEWGKGGGWRLSGVVQKSTKYRGGAGDGQTARWKLAGRSTLVGGLGCNPPPQGNSGTRSFGQYRRGLPARTSPGPPFSACEAMSRGRPTGGSHWNVGDGSLTEDLSKVDLTCIGWTEPTKACARWARRGGEVPQPARLKVAN